MSDLRTAAQQALEALEALQGGCTDSNDGTVEAITVWCPEIIDALKAALAEPVQDIEDAIEAAYWQFDCRKSGLNEWASAPQSERDAFKAEARKLVRGYFPTRQAQDTKREMLAVADAFIRGQRAALAEPVLNPAPGYCKHCKQYTIEEPLPAEPVQEPDIAQQVVSEQAEDEGLWFVAVTASEAYLQQALRRLHAAVEGEDDQDAD